MTVYKKLIKCSVCHDKVFDIREHVKYHGLSYKQYQSLYEPYVKKRSKIRPSRPQRAAAKIIKKRFPFLEVILEDNTISYDFSVDISMPQIKLAVEIDGPFHFQPIYGQHKLEQIQKFDSLKNDCLENKGWKIIRIPYLSSKYDEQSVLLSLEPTLNEIQKLVKDWIER